MSLMSEAVRAHLKTITAVTDLVGSGADARIYHDLAKQQVARPNLILIESSGFNQTHTAGDTGLNAPVLQVVAQGRTRPEADNLAQVVRENLLRMRGLVQGLWFDDVFADGSIDCGVDTSIDSSDSAIYWSVSTFDIWCNYPAVQGG